MKRLILLVISPLLLIFGFLIFHPNSDQQLIIGLQKNGLKIYFQKISDIQPVKKTLNQMVDRLGVMKASQELLTAAVVEELVYRTPILLIIIFFGAPRLSKIIFALIVLIFLSWYWSLGHNYPALIQSIVFLGGIINGLGIIYFGNSSYHNNPHVFYRSKTIGLLLAILLHGLANLFYLNLFKMF